MVVTALKVQVRNPERISVFIDNKYALSLTHTQLLDEKLRIGLEFDDSRLLALKKASDTGKAYERVLRFIMIRPRSRREVRDYFWRKQLQADIQTAIIAKLDQRGYLDDVAFARSWVESRRLTKPISAKRLRLELQQKGIDDATIQAEAGEDSYDEHASLIKLIAKKRRQSRYQDEQKLLQYLARQGFGYDDIKNALAEDASNPDHEEPAR